MVQAMRKMRPANYWDWLSRLGLDAKPDTDLPGAVAGQLKTKEQYNQHGVVTSHWMPIHEAFQERPRLNHQLGNRLVSRAISAGEL